MFHGKMAETEHDHKLKQIPLSACNIKRHVANIVEVGRNENKINYNKWEVCYALG